MFHILMRDKQTGFQHVAFRSNAYSIAVQIRDEMNRLNAEAARLTGQTIRFVYTILEK